MFDNEALAEVDADDAKATGLGEAIDQKFRDRIDYIREATDERDFYALKSLHFEKLVGRPDERSMRLNKQWRLIVRLEGEGTGKKVVIVRIEDYHR